MQRVYAAGPLLQLIGKPTPRSQFSVDVSGGHARHTENLLFMDESLLTVPCHQGGCALANHNRAHPLPAERKLPDHL